MTERSIEYTCRIIPRPDGDIGSLHVAATTPLKPGDLVELSHGLNLFRCPVCLDVWTMDTRDIHTIVQREPLTVSPSWGCPGGCHYWIRDGKVVS